MSPEAWRKVEELLVDALEAPAAERTAWAREASAGDDRFRRERQILAPLPHPNIARLLEGGIAKLQAVDLPGSTRARQLIVETRRRYLDRLTDRGGKP